MREDQYLKLQQLEEELLDVFIEEANPAMWPGRGIPLGQMDAKTRGDVYWCRKTAASALVLAGKIQGMIGAAGRTLGADGDPPSEAGPTDGAAAEEADQVDNAIAKAEREAERLLRELQSGASAGKAAFDRKVHGRAARTG